MSDVRLSEQDEALLSVAEDLLGQRAPSPPYSHWIIDQDGDDGGESFCPECAELELAELRAKQINNAVDPDDDEMRITYEYPESETDGCRHCDRCGALLAYTLTDDGVDSELEHFTEYPFDWNNSDECYHVARIAGGVFSPEQQQKLVTIIRRSINAPGWGVFIPPFCGG